MTYDCFDVAIDRKVAHLRLSRPDAFNSMIPSFWTDLPTVVRALSDAGDVRALVISSTGKHFSAGMDLSVFAGPSLQRDGEPGRAAMTLHLLVQQLQTTFTAFEHARMPVLAAIQGGCIGGAVDMVCAADMRYATADAFFCIQEINIGMVADVGTLQRLPKLIPMGVVKELAYTGRRMPAQKALGYGLVNEVFESPEAMLAAALQCAQEIASKPPVAIWGTKQAVNYARDHSVEDSLRQMGWLQGAIWSNQHVRESVTAMKQKRAGEFPALTPLQRFSELG